jgi:hypothetical protein
MILKCANIACIQHVLKKNTRKKEEENDIFKC